MNIILNDVTINYSERGMPNGTPVVFIHGFPFSGKMWEPQMPSLPNNIRAIVYDVRGHGSSDVGDGQFTIEQFVDDLIALLDHLVIKQVIICGLSMGGYIALRIIEKHPERVCGLILCDTKSQPDSDEAKIKRTETMKIIKSKGVQTFAEEFLKSIFWEETFINNPKAIEFIRNIILQNSPLGISGTLLALASRTDTTRVLSAINIPTCIMVGQHDILTPPSAAEVLHQNISGSEFHVIPNSGHISNLENTKEFNERLNLFLKKHL